MLKGRRPHLGRDFAGKWADHDRPRILLESPDGAEAYAVWKLLHRRGYGFSWCPGPRDDAEECALARTGQCPLVDTADAVVSTLDLSTSCCRAVAMELDRVAVGIPVVVVQPGVQAAKWAADELSACHIVSGPLTQEVLNDSLCMAGPDSPLAN
jgi:hypothetical protein